MRYKVFIFCLLLLTLFFASCSRDHQKKMEVIHYEWDCDLILANIITSILTNDLGYKVEMISATPAAAWAAVGTGMSDAILGSWQPITQGAYYESLKNRVDILNKVTEGVKIGIAVPSYVPINTIPELKMEAAHFDHKIYGIEPGAGMMVNLEASLKHYGLDEFEIVEGSEILMLTSLSEATDQQKWMAITAWSPHPMFQMQDIKYLKDPDGTFGAEEYIALVGRKNLSKDMPDAFRLLSRFKIDLKDLERMQYQLAVKKVPIRDLTQSWIADHRDEISAWIE